jgi:hypothetical protein
MGSIPDQVMEARQEIASDGEPLFTRERCVRDYSSSGELYHNIPEIAVELLDIDPDEDELEIEVFHDGYYVSKK